MRELYQKTIVKYGGPVIVVLILLLWASLAFGEVRVGGGVDIVHQPGMEVVTVKLDAMEVLYWEKNFGIGAAYDVGNTVGWQAGLGGIYVAKTDDDVGTRANFLLRGSYCWVRTCLSVRHISHGSSLGIARDRPNSGLNFIALEYRFR